MTLPPARLPVVVAVLALAAVAGGCTRAAGKCASDADCDILHQGSNKCDVDSGLCLCTDDAGCSAGELCNAAGRCQATGGCAANDDCGAGLFCDVTTSQCLAEHGCGEGNTCCTLDDQCPFRQICDVVTQTCVAGCRDDADCLIGEGCQGAGFGRLGVCGTACTSELQCRFGQLCNLSTGTCEDDNRGPYCGGCSGGVNSDDCGTFGNFCLLDTVNGGSYCGVDCAQGQTCPFGYECIDVIILPRSTLPTCALPEACVDGHCARTGAVCGVDEDCPEGPPGSDCPRADVGNCELSTGTACSSDDDCPSLGACLKQECRQREGASFGVCSCTRDSDCPSDTCQGADVSDLQHPVAGHCELSGRSCFEDAECDVITCVGGGCLLGKNCKPGADHTCVDFLPAQ